MRSRNNGRKLCVVSAFGVIALIMMCIYLTKYSDDTVSVPPAGIYPFQSTEEIDFPTINAKRPPPAGVQPFQSTEETDFPSSTAKKPRIPHILHQIFTTEMVPEDYVPCIKSFQKYNPAWEYRFWTYESGRKLIKKYHPELLEKFDSFGGSVMKADVIRVVVLYQFGGLYSDLDMEFLRPLDRVTLKYACILALAPCEIAAFSNMSYMVVNGIMFSRPKHPFFKLLLDGFKNANPSAFPGYQTGPGYVTKQFKIYNGITPEVENRNDSAKTSNSPNFYKGLLSEDHENATYVPNSQYFMDNLGPTDDKTLTDMCTEEKKPSLSWLLKRACLEYEIRKDIRKNRRYTFTVHHWAALWLKPKETFDQLKKINIKEIVPNCIFYE